ncbi:hypothetical protein [Streptomyces antibioticus]|uniref:hypothetical protein n=1 Tax=Streptomyces antibioticus TaxID=1890 RepID=UPI0036F7418B
MTFKRQAVTMSTLQQRARDVWQFLTGTTVRKVATGTSVLALGATTFLANLETISPEGSAPDTTITLDAPADSSTITRCLEFVSGHGLIPNGKHLWVAVMPGSSAEREGHVTLVGKGEAVQTSRKGRGEWKVVQVNVGGETRINYHYRLFAVLLSDDTHKIVVNSAVNITDFAPEVVPESGKDRWRIEYARLPGEWSDPVEVVRNGSEEKTCLSKSD